jgi:hypothetical protein
MEAPSSAKPNTIIERLKKIIRLSSLISTIVSTPLFPGPEY